MNGLVVFSVNWPILGVFALYRSIQFWKYSQSTWPGPWHDNLKEWKNEADLRIK